jgi:hypothetical protein
MAAEMRDRWYTADFEVLSWHDVHVHGFRIVEGEAGAADLALDLDFILAWLGPEDGRYRFRVAQAILQFHDVFDLRVALDYAACSAGTCPFSIDRIVREPLHGGPGDENEEQSDDHRFDAGPWRWRVEVNWPEGALEFQASGFSQWLLGDAVEQDAMWLPAALRM